MKKLLCVLCIISLNVPLMAYSGDKAVKLKPMWEEHSKHNILKRCLCVKESVDEMMDVYDQLWKDGFLSDDELQQIQMAYMRIIFNLGLPSPT